MTKDQSSRRRRIAAFVFGGAVAAVVALAPAASRASDEGPYGGFTGAPGEDTCRHCHKTAPLNVAGGMVDVQGFPATYVPGQTYQVTVTVGRIGMTRWGFEATVLNAAKRPSGKLVVTDPLHTKIVPGIFFLDRRYIEQKFAGSYGGQPDAASWQFAWRAPKKGQGAVTIYVTANAANNDDKTKGDFIYYKQVSALPASQ